MHPPLRIEDEFLRADLHRQVLDWTLANEALFAPSTVTDGEGQIERMVAPEARVSLTARGIGPIRALVEPSLRQATARIADALGYAGPPLDTLDLELVAHGDGAHFELHADTYAAEGADGAVPIGSRRRISATYYFHRRPKGFIGGQLQLFGLPLPDGTAGSVRVEPLDNRLAAFPSWLPHRVEPVRVPSRAFADSRFALTCWYCITTEFDR